MIFRVLVILVLLGQGLISSAAPLGVPDQPMPECHEMSASEHHPADDAMHCEGQCCCPGVCGAFAVVPSTHQLFPYRRAANSVWLARQVLPDHSAPVYRPPILA